MQSHVITNLKASVLSSHVASLYRDLPVVVVNRHMHSLFTHSISQATGERLSLIFLGFFLYKYIILIAIYLYHSMRKIQLYI